MIEKKVDSGLNDISHYELDGLARAKFQKRINDGPMGDEDDRIKRAFEVYRGISFNELPPSFKGLLRFDAFVSLVRPLQKDQTKKAKVRLQYADGVLEIRIDPNTLDDMRHFLASLPYLDCIVTCDLAMHRLLSFFHPDEQSKLKFLKRN